MATESTRDHRIRLAAFDWLKQQQELHGDVLPWSLLLDGFEFQGDRVPLLSQQGIFKPAVLPEIPLSIRTSPSGPYEDRMSGNDVLLYRYRGTDPETAPKHRDNVGLKTAMERQLPLIYFYGVVQGRYLPVWPVFIVGADDESLTFSVAVDDARVVKSQLLSELEADARENREPQGGSESREGKGEGKEYGTSRGGQEDHVGDTETEIRRAYVTTASRRRLHQEKFRVRVLRAYREQCAMCRLRHEELLDAAHIVDDSEGGEPVVSNGLALCKLHHAAFDDFFVGVRPDGIVEVRQDVLDEEDGPMLLHGLQGLHGRELYLPHRKSDRPDPDLLARKYERFRMAG